MGRKPKFRPEIRRVKLNPEQAVLMCSCFDYKDRYTTGLVTGHYAVSAHICLAGTRRLDLDIPTSNPIGAYYGSCHTYSTSSGIS